MSSDIGGDISSLREKICELEKLIKHVREELGMVFLQTDAKLQDLLNRMQKVESQTAVIIYHKDRLAKLEERVYELENKKS
jgi:BMFP domain-containing protein YqiC